MKETNEKGKYGSANGLFDAEGCVTSVTADYFIGRDGFRFDREIPLRISGISSRDKAKAVKTALCEAVGGGAKIEIHFGACDKPPQKTTVDGADGLEDGCYTENACLVLFPCELTQRERFDYGDLTEIVRVLRSPDGCPWDRVQTHESIRSNMIEEAYEVVEGINQNAPDKLEEELGDVLLQVGLHSDIAERNGEFTKGDVLTRLCKKLIFRHTHVFGGDSAKDADKALGVWEKNKKIEKGFSGVADEIRAVPKEFPALLRAYKVAKKLNKAGRLEATLDGMRKRVDLGETSLLSFELFSFVCDVVKADRGEPEISLIDAIDTAIKMNEEN